MEQNEDEVCMECHGEGTIDYPLSNTWGGCWFRYCDCPAGTKAANEDIQRKFPKGRCEHGIDRRRDCVDCLKNTITQLKTQIGELQRR